MNQIVANELLSIDEEFWASLIVRGLMIEFLLAIDKMH